MNERSSVNVSNLGTTPENAAANTRKLTEADFLRQQKELARQALSRTASLLGQNLGHGADPRAWAKEHPWLTTGGAAVGGFLAVTMLVSSREDRALRKLAKIERAIAPRPAARDGREPEERLAKHGILQGLLNEVFKAVRPAVLSAITAGITAKAAQQDNNGADSESESELESGPFVVPPATSSGPAQTPPQGL